jgi:hypothetical protein
MNFGKALAGLARTHEQFAQAEKTLLSAQKMFT